MDYRKQIGYLKGLCKGLGMSAEEPTGKLLVAIVDTLDTFADAITDANDGLEELETDLQELSDEVSELETLTEDMDKLEEYLDDLGETMQDLAAMLSAGAQEEDIPFITPPGQSHLRIVGKDEGKDNMVDIDSLDFLDEDEIAIHMLCPHCGKRIDIDESSVVIEKRDT
ncbi:hypothetical protein FACS1894217_10020 [Clostridia bacterium]|nr:hypothetical protein FACS1894217_10020 [Clostridia bacterium]